MFSVSPEIYRVLSPVSRYLFAFFALMLLLFALLWIRAEKKARKDRLRDLPGAGTVGELLVLSGGDELPRDTWFPVPREGVLGSLRSCDLVVPCPGVHAQHLDFVWLDGTGLLIRPRSGCSALIDGIPVDRKNAADHPLIHGSFLQVGAAVLRLQLFSALEHTKRTVLPHVPASPMEFPAMQVPQQLPFPDPAPQRITVQVPPQDENPSAPQPGPDPLQPDAPAAALTFSPQEQDLHGDNAEANVGPVVPPAVPRRKRADRWKEDWSE